MAEIKISDLSVGDWVKCNGFKASIAGYNAESESIQVLTKQKNKMWFGIDDIEPIPLTAEILEKNGFILVVVNKKFNDWYDNHITIRKYYNEDNYHLFVCGQKIEFKMLSVHQLQHALRLAGVGKEIEV